MNAYGCCVVSIEMLRPMTSELRTMDVIRCQQLTRSQPKTMKVSYLINRVTLILYRLTGYGCNGIKAMLWRQSMDTVSIKTAKLSYYKRCQSVLRYYMCYIYIMMRYDMMLMDRWVSCPVVLRLC